MNSENHDDIGQAILGTTWGEAAGRYADYTNGRFAWFKQAKFGIFIHWGVYSLLEGEWEGKEYRGIAEWIMRKLQIPVKKYEHLAGLFNPVSFDAREWLNLFKIAGAQYITVTAKHHDGFCLFDSDASDFNVAKSAGFGRDIIKELSSACLEHGLRLCLYYSQDQDWHEPIGGGNNWDFPAARTEQERRQYVEQKVIPQIRELLTRYGHVGYFWFDTPGYLSEEEAGMIKKSVAELQTECMSSSRLGYNLGDFHSLPDQMVPTRISHDRCETAMTHNDSWAYSKFDQNWKTPETLIQQLVQTVSCGANYLLNIGPDKDGKIPSESIAALHRIGKWLSVNGESIYNSQPNPLNTNLHWGVCTAKPGKIYLHLISRPTDNKLIFPYTGKIDSVSFLATGAQLAFQRQNDKIIIDLPETLPDPVVSVIVAQLTMDVKNTPVLMGNQTNILLSGDFLPVHTTDLIHVEWMHETFGNWHHKDILLFKEKSAYAEIRVNALTDGKYRLYMEYDFCPAAADARRHTLEGRNSVMPLRRESGFGTFAVDDQEYKITLPFAPPGYFENIPVCSQPVEITRGFHTLTLRAQVDGFPEIASVSLVPE